MAMLAEPRRKIRWSLNPNGNFWSKNENKYGQKLLERMGWRSGKGLGKNEDGNTEHIKVTYKNDNKGVGYSGSNYDKWIAHEDDFNSLLSSLNDCYSQSSSTTVQTHHQNLEEKSKKIKSRLHYQRLIQGKNLSNCTEKDMECIFGRKNKKTLPTTDVKEDSNVNPTSIFSTSATNSNDYFSNKMQLLSRKRLCKSELSEVCKFKDKPRNTKRVHFSNIVTVFMDASVTTCPLSDVEHPITSEENSEVENNSLFKIPQPKKKRKATEILEKSANSLQTNMNSSAITLSEMSGVQYNDNINSKHSAFHSEVVSESTKNKKTDMTSLSFKEAVLQLHATKKKFHFANQLGHEIDNFHHLESTTESDLADFQFTDRLCNVKATCEEKRKHKKSKKTSEIKMSTSVRECGNHEKQLPSNTLELKSIVEKSIKIEEIIMPSLQPTQCGTEKKEYSHMQKDKKRKFSQLEEMCQLNTYGNWHSQQGHSGEIEMAESVNHIDQKLTSSSCEYFFKNNVENSVGFHCIENLCNSETLTDKIKSKKFKMFSDQAPSVKNNANCEDKSTCVNTEDIGTVNEGNHRHIVPYCDIYRGDNKPAHETLNSEITQNEIDCKEGLKKKKKKKSKCKEKEIDLNNEHKSVLKSENVNRVDEKTLAHKDINVNQLAVYTGDKPLIRTDNDWLLSQKMCKKMSKCKLMLEKLKYHKILSTTNLLSLKGYGNW